MCKFILFVGHKNFGEKIELLFPGRSTLEDCEKNVLGLNVRGINVRKNVSDLKVWGHCVVTKFVGVAKTGGKM